MKINNRLPKKQQHKIKLFKTIKSGLYRIGIKPPNIIPMPLLFTYDVSNFHDDELL